MRCEIRFTIGGVMITIIMFLVGFYLGILLFSLLAMARRKTGNKSLARLPTLYPLHKANQIMSLLKVQLTHHVFGDTGNVL